MKKETIGILRARACVYTTLKATNATKNEKRAQDKHTLIHFKLLEITEYKTKAK